MNEFGFYLRQEVPLINTTLKKTISADVSEELIPYLYKEGRYKVKQINNKEISSQVYIFNQISLFFSFHRSFVC